MTDDALIATLPRATLRLQLNKDFTFAQARARIPYFAQLGISHLYLSPILTARAGSIHGYDVVDHSAINPELGGENEFRALVAALRAQHMGVIVDIVPNHMAVGGNDNRLWLDVLEWGAESRYADFFDIDWDVPDPALKNRLLAPFLGKPYGDALQAGEITLHFDATNGRFAFHYYDHYFPVAPQTYAQLLRFGGDILATQAQRFRSIQHERAGTRSSHFAEDCAALSEDVSRNDEINAALQALLQRFNGGGDVDKKSADKNAGQLLHQLLQRQHYRLASWRTAADEINWRRFFDVIQLAGIRVQAPAAFEIVHATTLRLYAEGLIDGVRVDHIDGLSYPRDYCHRLRTRLKRLTAARPLSAAAGQAYFIVEKILAPDERLPRDWRVDGTTGYSFMNEVGALLHDARGETTLADCWADLSGRADDFGVEMKRARRRILRDLLAAEFSACAYALHKIARDDIATRDWSLFSIRRTLAELLIQFPIYRTYADASGRSSADNEIMHNAIADALPECRPSDAALLDHIDNWLGREPPRHIASRLRRQARLRAIARFQQLSAPLAAKAVEDTAFYRYSKLLSRNEVGAIPTQFSLAPEEFHRELSRRAANFPRAMLATATHDHKRGEDLRARLAVLSEVPEVWREHVRQWREMNSRHKIEPREWPQAVDEYMLYQMLAG
ncbi:MAG TPA: malto-oligosyltrehalose synthase, partial [Spongiibacteraceae bacterium]